MARGKRLQAGVPDDEAIAELHGIAFSEAAKILSVSAGDAVDDIAQASVLEYHAYAATHDVENPGGLVRIIARRKAYKTMAQWGIRREEIVVDADADDDEFDAPVGRAAAVEKQEPASRTGDPWAPIEQLGTEELLRFAIAQLDDRDQQIVAMTYLQEPRLKAPQVAQRLGLEATTVRNHLVRIRRELRALLADDPWFAAD